MAFRPFFHLSDNAYKCIFTTIQFKPKLYMVKEYKQIRNYGKIGGKKKLLQRFLSNELFKKQSESKSNLWKPFIFTVMFSGTTFVAATIWQYERLRNKTYNLIRSYKQLEIHRTGWRREMELWWKKLSEGEKLFVPICFLNVLVFLLWHIRTFQPVMFRYFSSSPSSGSLPLLFQTFSHCSLIHLIINMYVLYTFSSVGVSVLGTEQALALYLTSGVISSFTSRLYKVAFSIKEPSLGASGALMGLLAFVSTELPNMHMYLIFAPSFQFTADMSLKAIMAIDCLGCLLRWQRFDHAAHLGGALFGIFWHMWGSKNIWGKREPIIEYWRQLREPRKSY